MLPQSDAIKNCSLKLALKFKAAVVFLIVSYAKILLLLILSIEAVLIVHTF